MATGRIGTTPVLTTRWSKAPSAGTTSLSGLDDNSVSLVYSVGYEAVYRNGTLLSRGNDYTATNGTTITLVDATLTGDIIEVFANQTIPLTDTYSQTVSDGRFIKNTLTTTTGDIIYASAANTPARLAIGSTDQVLKVSGGIPAWGAAPAASFVGCRAFPSSDQTISNNTGTTVNLGNETYDTDGFHSTSTNTSRMTIPSGKNGYYLVIGKIGYFSNTTGARQVRLLKNGTIIEFNSVASAGAGAAGNKTVYSSSAIINCAVGDYIEMAAYQDSGGNLNLDGSSDTTSLTVQFLGA